MLTLLTSHFAAHFNAAIGVCFRTLSVLYVNFLAGNHAGYDRMKDMYTAYTIKCYWDFKFIN